MPQFFCQICMCVASVEEGYRLPCSHIYCKECLIGYIRNKISDGKIVPTCFHMSENIPMQNSDYNGTIVPSCSEIIGSVHIEELLADDKVFLDKYSRFKIMKENKYARECPFCFSISIGNPAESPSMKCINASCNQTFCYYHSNAHDFSIFPTCAAYDASLAPTIQSSVELIASLSKPCPVCLIPVLKSGGCNHMKCQCGAAFCWICGQEIEVSSPILRITSTIAQMHVPLRWNSLFCFRYANNIFLFNLHTF